MYITKKIFLHNGEILSKGESIQLNMQDAKIYEALGLIEVAQPTITPKVEEPKYDKKIEDVNRGKRNK